MFIVMIPQVWNIDESAACKSCAKNLVDNGYIKSNWECAGHGLHEQKIWYEPKKKYYVTRVRTTSSTVPQMLCPSAKPQLLHSMVVILVIRDINIAGMVGR